jgi:hypothetical protein
MALRVWFCSTTRAAEGDLQMNVNPGLLQGAIEQNTEVLNIAPGISRNALLCAICDNESSFGADCNPHPEAAYMSGSIRKYLGIDPSGRPGRWFNAAAWNAWGMHSAMSHGPTQIMGAVLWDLGYKGPPYRLAEDLSMAIHWTVVYINTRGAGAQTVEQVGDAYNSGSYRDKFQPTAYMNALRENYTRWLQIYPEPASSSNA